MTAIRIIATVIMGIIAFVAFLINLVVFTTNNFNHEIRNLTIGTLISWCLCAFVIVAVWIV